MVLGILVAFKTIEKGESRRYVSMNGSSPSFTMSEKIISFRNCIISIYGEKDSGVQVLSYLGL